MPTFTELRDHALSKEGAVEDYPFDETTAVFKVGGKMFLLCSPLRDPLRFNVKCDPDRALMLRDVFAAVGPGYHMNKRHWNTVTIDGSISEADILEFIDHSYDLVVASLPKGKRNRDEK